MAKDNSIEVIRHLLGSIDLSDVDLDEKEQTEAERMAYCSAIATAWPVIIKDIKKLMHEQLMYSANQAETWERVVFGRGTFNGLALLEEHWKKVNAEYVEKIKSQPDYDKHNPVGEI